MASQYTREQILDIIERQAQESGIPREDFLRFAYIETGGRFNPNASNPSGAKGLFQFVPGTADLWVVVNNRDNILVPDDRDVDGLRWLIEELRVSFFAQELRTPQPVSIKRLDKAWLQLTS